MVVFPILLVLMVEAHPAAGAGLADGRLGEPSVMGFAEGGSAPLANGLADVLIHPGPVGTPVKSAPGRPAIETDRLTAPVILLGPVAPSMGFPGFGRPATGANPAFPAAFTGVGFPWPPGMDDGPRRRQHSSASTADGHPASGPIAFVAGFWPMMPEETAHQEGLELSEYHERDFRSGGFRDRPRRPPMLF